MERPLYSASRATFSESGSYLSKLDHTYPGFKPELTPVHPNLLHLGHLTLPTFGVLAAAGLMLALAVSQRTARLIGIDPEQLWDAGLFAVLAAFLCSRLLLVVEHFASFRAYPLLLLAVPSLTPSGLLLTAVSTYLWLRWKDLPVLRTLDAWTPCAALVWAFLALGHFAEGSDPGIPIHRATFQPLYPVALFTCVVALTLFLAAYAWLRRRPRPGQTVGLTAVAAGIAQFFLTFLRQPGLAMPLGLDAIQYVALGLLLTGTLLLLAPHPIS